MRPDTPSAVRRVLRAALRVAVADRERFVRRAARGDEAVAVEVLDRLRDAEETDLFLKPPTVPAPRRPLPPAPTTGPAPDDLYAGRYRIGKQLGAGGSAAVYEAKDELAGGRVAVKVMTALGPHDLPRLRREAAALRWLRLPGVVQLLDDGVQSGHGFIVMEFVDGDPFPGVPVPAPWETVRRATIALFEALARIHWAGVVHGDLKPDNVLVGADGLPVVLDLGLSTGPELWDLDGATGLIAGTPHYLAPELLNGVGPDVASDLYAAGVMLFHALSGRRVHEAEGVVELFHLRQTSPAPRLRDVAPAVPAPVSVFVDRLLETDPAMRPASAREALAMLERPMAEVVGASDLPWLGSRAVVDALVDAARRGVSLDLAGAVGAGRTRCLAEAAAILEREGRTVVRIGGGRRPPESLRPAVGPSECPATERVEGARRAMERRLSACVAAGNVVIVDDVEALDRLSCEVIDRCRSRGSVLRALRVASPPALALEPLTEAEIRPLFAGTDRVHLLPRDAAHEMHRRTAGMPARIASEITAWERAGLARREGAEWVITRAAVERLRAGLWVSVHATALREGATVDDPALEEVVVLVDLAAPAATLEVVSRVLDRPRRLVEADLDELVRLGVIRREEDGRLHALRPSHGGVEWPADRRLAVHRAIADALPVGSTERLYHLISAGATAEVPEAALAAGRDLLDRGETDRAAVVAEEGLRALQAGADAAVAGDLLVLLLKDALRGGRMPAFDKLLYHLQRAPRSVRGLAAIELIARAAISVLQGHAAHAIQQLEELPEGGAPDLEGSWWSVRIYAARIASLESERDAVARVSRWAKRHPERGTRLPLEQWQGWLRYREGRYAEAAEIHERSAESATDPSTALSARLNAASAWLEANEWDRARRLADRAGEEAAEQRHALHAARAEWLSRAAAYRGGRTLEVDHDLVAAVGRLGSPYTEALILLNEAAVGWRAGETETARALALEAAGRWGGMGQSEPADLATALAVAAGAAIPAADLAKVLEHAASSETPGTAVQILGLVARARPLLGARHAGIARRRAGEIDETAWQGRREVLSIREALAAIDEAERAVRPGEPSLPITSPPPGDAR